MPKEPSPVFDIRSEPETLQFLLQVAEVANSSLDLDELLERFAEVIRQAVDYEILAILLPDKSTQELCIRYAIGHTEEVVRSVRIPPREGITGAAVAERVPILVTDVGADARYIQTREDVCCELAVPMIVRDRVVGVIDLQCTQEGCLNERHRDLLSVVAGRLGLAIEPARLYRSTLQQARTLATLSEISREFSSILNLDDLLRKIADLLHRLIGHDAFHVLLLDPQHGLLQLYLSLPDRDQTWQKDTVPIGTGVIGHAVAERRSLLIPDVTRDPRYITVNPRTLSELAVPLVAKEQVIGVLNLESKRKDFFTRQHLQMVELLGPQVAIAIENARLYQQLALKEARMESDLRAARELQYSLLPRDLPEIPGLELYARFEPARELGGDLYDFIEYKTDDGLCSGLGIFTGDVSGKGASAALYAALSHGLLRTLAARCQPVGRILHQLNQALWRRRIAARSLALCYAFLDPQAWTLEIANGGLPHPIFCQEGKVLPVHVEGVPLGLLENVEYQPVALQLRPGDLAVFYSDGITENLNRDGEEFGRHRLQELVCRHCAASAGELVERIFEEAHRWSEEKEAEDDRTVVALKVGENSPGGAAPCA